MPVGEIFLYVIWALIAVGSIVATALILRRGE
jgi:hypothetical protein